MTGPKARTAILVALLLAVLMPLPGASALAVDDPNLRLGKIDPGHTSVHHRNVTNSGTETVQVDLQVACNCPIHVSVTPQTFELAPGARKQIEITVAIPEDADPGLHDTRIQVTQRSAGGSGGTAVASVAINAVYSVRTVQLYYNPPGATGEVPARFVNGYEDTLEVHIEGTLEGQGVTRDLEPLNASAPGHPERASTTHLMLPLPLNETDPEGVYTLTLTTTWASPDGKTGSTGPHTLVIAHGALVHLTKFHASTAAHGLRFTGTLTSLSSETLEAWIVVDVTGPDGTTTTVETPSVELDPQGEEEVTFEWTAPKAGAYSVVAQAAWRTDSGTEGRSSAWPPQTESAPEPQENRADGEIDADGTEPAGMGSQAPLLAIVALAGIGLGAAVAILARRGGGK